MEVTYNKKEEFKEFFNGIITIGVPIMIQSLINSLVNMLAVVMVGQLGEVEITASSLGNAWFMLYILLCGGITAAGGIFVAQNWGKKAINKIHQYMGIMFIGASAIMLVFSISSIFFYNTIIHFYSKDIEVIQVGGKYIQIIGFAFLFFTITNVFVTSLRSIENTKIPMLGTVLALICNLFFNYLLIFGNLGFPKLGVLGAAIATLIARIFECSFIVMYVYLKKMPIAGSLSDFFKIELITVKQYLKYGFFIILGEISYAIANTLYNVAYKYTGTQSQAALQIVGSIRSLAMVLTLGIGASAGVIIGKMLGMGLLEKAKRFCRRYLIFAPLIAAIIALIMVIMSPLILTLFNISDESLGYAKKMIWVLAFQLPFIASNFTIVAGILRCGGDSTYCFVANTVAAWFFGLPIAFLATTVWHLPIYLVFLLITIDEVSKFIICLPRAIKNKWINNLT